MGHKNTAFSWGKKFGNLAPSRFDGNSPLAVVPDDVKPNDQTTNGQTWTARVVLCLGGFFHGSLPSRGLTYPTKREKEDHLQNAIFGGYVSFHGSFNLFVVRIVCLIVLFVFVGWLSCHTLSMGSQDGRKWSITMAILSPLRIGLWDPFQMAFLWLINW